MAFTGRVRLDGDGLEFIGFARDGAKRMDRLVLDLLELARIERRGDPIIRMPLLPTVQLALTNLGPTITQNQAEVIVDGSVHIPIVMGDPVQITRLFQNLIGNALKYRSEERQPVVRASCRSVDSMIEVEIADNGIGIEPQYFDRIFGIFQRLHTREKYEGTGIGLAVCKKIVERHHGRIWVESKPSEGSTFIFTLPCAH